MYTYYTLHLFKVQVPKKFKRVLTTAQISQFLIGVYFALAHLFVAYKIPVTVPATIASAASAAPSVVSSAAHHAASAGSKLLSSQSLSSIAAAVTADSYAWLKKLALKAANFEGPAEHIWAGSAEKYGAGLLPKITTETTRYVTQYQTVRCIDTNAQAFAIWLNVVYLAPLTFLFGRFFLKAYIWGQPPKAAKGAKTQQNGHATVSKAAVDAARKTSQEFERQGESLEKRLESVSSDIKSEIDDMNLEKRLAMLEKDLKTSHSSTSTSTGFKSSGDVIEESNYSSSHSFTSKTTDTSKETYAEAVKTNGDAH